MNTIRWITPRIRYIEFTDSVGNECCDIAYNVWDIRRPETFAIIRKSIIDGDYKHYLKMPWYVKPVQNKGIEERRFINLADEGEEQLSRYPVKQMIRNFASIWHWCPSIRSLVLRDLKKFQQENPKYREEWERWYRVKRQDPYRKPHFYRDFLKLKQPMDVILNPKRRRK